MTGTARKRKHVVIAGGGVAALETMLALRSLAGHVLELTLLTSERDFLYRPATVAEAFGRGEARSYSIPELVGDTGGGRVVWGTLAEVLADEHVAVTGAGELLTFDSLVVATGAEPRSPLPGALTFGGHADVPALAQLLDDLTSGRARSVAFALTPAHSWPLPLYELALMTASHLRARGARGAEMRLLTPEARPLELFGAATSEQLEPLLRARGIEVRCGSVPASVDGTEVMLAGGERVGAHRVLTIPVLAGRPIEGLPHDAEGFLEVDAHGRLIGLADVYAAGDNTAFPLKQGGLAAQQADAVAEAIAADVGVAIRPQPFSPVLRGLLMTGGAPIYLRSEPQRDRRSDGRHRPAPRQAAPVTGAPRAAAAGQPLWWPPAKIAGRYLAPTSQRRVPPVRPICSTDRSAIPGAPLSAAEHDDALELALLLAECDARWGDYASALARSMPHELCNGACFTPELEAKRRAWTVASKRAT